MSDVPVRLIPMLCVKCQFPVPANPDEVAWVCEQCGQGLILDDERGVRAQEVFFSSDLAQGEKGRPFWVAPGQVVITERQTYKGDEMAAARQFWANERLFFVPAWQASLDEVVTTGVSMLRVAPKMQPGSPASFVPAVTLPDDMQALGEFIIAHIETDRRDALRRVNFTLTLKSPQLWVLP